MDFSRTLIIKPSSMGDIVQALPVLTALKEAHPEAHVTWLVARPFAGILEGHPRLDEVLAFDRHRFAHIGRNLPITGEFLEFLRDLRRRGFSLVIDLQGLFRSGLFALASGAQTRVGFRAARELAPLFYTNLVSLPRKEMHAVDRYLAVAQYLGIAMPKATDHLPVPAEARAAARQRLAAAGLAPAEPFVVVCAHARWETKQWPPERFALVLDRVWAEAGARAVLVGGGPAVPIGRTIGAAMAERPIDLTDKTTLKELVAVIAEARAMLTNDSGPMHVAAAVGTPVVAIFGPTNPARTGPYGAGHRVLTGRAPCAPCYRRRCLYSAGAAALACLTSITADEAARCLLETWRQEPGR
jgi:lipopolysaccharide heptosyltransferase I